MQVKDIMRQPVIFVREEASLAETAQLMLTHHIGCMPVVNAQSHLTGIITESNFVAKEKGVPFSTFRAPQVFGQWLGEKHLEDIYRQARTLTAGEVMHRQVVTVTADDSLETVVKLMLRHDINRIPVVQDGIPIGIISRHDMLQVMLSDLTEEK
jgi:CBS domain-containing protein